MIRLLGLLGLLFSSLSIHAATLVFDGATWIGINQLGVGGASYSVRFKGGAYADVYGTESPCGEGFISPSCYVSLTPTSETLISAIYDEVQGLSEPILSQNISGCENTTGGCFIMAPVIWYPDSASGAPGPTEVETNAVPIFPGEWPPSGEPHPLMSIYTGIDNGTWAVVVSDVPIPSAAWLFGPALVGLAGLKRRTHIQYR